MKRVVVYASTRNMYGQTIASIKSLLEHTRVDRVWMLAEDDRLPIWVPEVVQCLNVSGQTFFPEDGANAESAWTYMDLIRLALPQVFQEEHRMLWLDTDVIVEKDIGPLFDIDLMGNYIAMVKEPARTIWPFTYYNAGVFLMDLDRVRREKVDLKMIDWINRNYATAPGQDPLNVFFQGEILELGPEWNTAGVITQDHPDPYIRHYAGYLKPAGRDVFRAYGEAEWRVKDAD